MTRRLPCLLALLLSACVEVPPEPRDASTPELDARVGRRDGGPDAGPPADLDGFLEWQLRAGGIAGAAAAIVRQGEVAWVGTYGWADIASGRAVDEHTLFMVASVSKTMVAVRALQLVEAGRLDLDAPLESYVSYPVRHPAHPEQPITSRMLLTHTGGLADDWLRLADASSGEDPTETLSGFGEGYVTPGGAYWSDANWSAAAPGTRKTYSNAAFGLLGDVLERAGGRPLPEQTRSELFERIGMDGAGWLLSEVDRGRLATPYSYGSGEYTPLSPGGFAFYPATSLRVSIRGLARFVAALLRGGELEGARFLEEASVSELLRDQVPAIARGQALAFSERRVAGQLYVGHSGSSTGNSAQLLLSRDGTHGIVLLTNSDAYLRSRFGLDAGDRAMEAILERLHAEAVQ